MTNDLISDRCVTSRLHQRGVLNCDSSASFTHCTDRQKSNRKPFCCDALCPLLALSGHLDPLNQCPLLGVKRTLCGRAAMSAFDPKRTFSRGVVAAQNDGWTPFRRSQIPAVIASVHSMVRTGPEPWGRQCDDAPSLKELLLWEWHGRSLRARSNRCQ